MSPFTVVCHLSRVSCFVFFFSPYRIVLFLSSFLRLCGSHSTSGTSNESSKDQGDCCDSNEAGCKQ